MRRTKDMKDAKFNPILHIQSRAAAKETGYSARHFNKTIAPGYNLVKYVDGRNVFYLKDSVERLKKRLKRNLTNGGKHKKGKLPRKAARRRAIRSDAGIPKSPDIQMTVTPDQVKALIAKGVRISFIMN